MLKKYRKKSSVINWLNKDLGKKINEKIEEVLSFVDEEIKNIDKDIKEYNDVYNSNFKYIIDKYNGDGHCNRDEHCYFYGEQIRKLSDIHNLEVINKMEKENLLNIKNKIEKMLRCEKDDE